MDKFWRTAHPIQGSSLRLASASFISKTSRTRQVSSTTSYRNIEQFSQRYLHQVIQKKAENESIGNDEARAHVGYFPANEIHGFRNLSDEDCEFYCVIGCVGKGENCLGIQG